ncbi:hypothetical protein Avbf_09463 [Armadillidium vulgare]|nr:hypothetical protein Avbf_09463 [Armadillidium vulgare]
MNSLCDKHHYRGFRSMLNRILQKYPPELDIGLLHKFLKSHWKRGIYEIFWKWVKNFFVQPSSRPLGSWSHGFKQSS